LKTALENVQSTLNRPTGVRGRRAVVVPIVLLLLAAGGYGGWLAVRGQRAAWARGQIPEIERLTQTPDRHTDAIRLARAVERYAPDEVRRVRQRWHGLRFTSSPEGADVQLKDYADVNGAWESIGRTPIRDYLVPQGSYRAQLTLAGHDPVEVSISPLPRSPVRLWAVGTAPSNMTFVDGGQYGIGVAKPVTLPDFWIDRTEVTNEAYKRFVDAGGYRNPQFWKQPFITPAGPLTFDEGRGQYPVSGISWF
jgi:hypothetical protein